MKNKYYVNISILTMPDVISVRIKRSKEKSEGLGITFEKLWKKLQKMIREKKEKLKEIVMKIKELMKDVSEDDWVRAVRESRDER